MTDIPLNLSRLIIISGPSGAGKSTVVKTLLEKCPLPLELSVSATTRLPRSGEIQGKNYFFLSYEEFERRRISGEFLECKEVFGRGDWYGTLNAVVSSGLERGKWLILEIDVQGALSILERRVDPITIFVHPGTLEELESRLRQRGTETESAIQRRLEVAREEIAHRHRYKHQVVNRKVNDAVDEICQLLLQYQGDKTAC
ncbi:MAG: guanylate kinase [Pirellulaceae bacterium]|nr:guanylate kinase [Pirellulaceae bacterium]